MLVVALLVGGAMLGGSYYFWGAMTEKYTKQQRALQTIRRKYHTVDEEERIIESFLPRYRALEDEGIIGREYRLNWIENLRAVSNELRLPNLRYSIDSQLLYEPEFPVAKGKFKVFVSRMKLSLGLLHEGDLLRFFQELDQRATGLYSVSDCSIRRAGPSFQADPTKSNLNAACTLQWYTVKQQEET